MLDNLTSHYVNDHCDLIKLKLRSDEIPIKKITKWRPWICRLYDCRKEFFSRKSFYKHVGLDHRIGTMMK